MQLLNPYEAPKERNEAGPALNPWVIGGWRTYFRVHFFVVVSSGLMVTLASLKINGQPAFAKPPAVVLVPLVVITYVSFVFLPLSPLIDVYLLLKALLAGEKCLKLFIADSVVSFGHFFFILPMIS